MSIIATTTEPLNGPDAFIFMKVGDHANESWESILDRKRREIDAVGWTLWGYGGSACHPLTQVQPFMRSFSERGARPKLLMKYISSNADQRESLATRFSSDGINWDDIPIDIKVTGSKHALIISEILPVEQEIVFDDYEVGVGLSAGKAAPDYLQGRVDKGCLIRSAEGMSTPEKRRMVQMANFAATLKDPYAVLVRS